MTSRTRRPRGFGGWPLVAGWVAATALASAGAWWAVGLVGNQVLEASSPRVGSSAAAGRSPSAGPSAGEDGATVRPGPSRSRPPSRLTAAPASANPAPPPATTAAGSGAGSFTFTPAGGSLAVRCQGDSVRLVYATPADGWRVSTDNAGPEEVEVHFTNGDRESQVQIACRAGRPAAESDGG